MIILETILTNFMASVIFRGRRGGRVNWIELKTYCREPSEKRMYG
jgi:hypothetical protein